MTDRTSREEYTWRPPAIVLAALAVELQSYRTSTLIQLASTVTCHEWERALMWAELDARMPPRRPAIVDRTDAKCTCTHTCAWHLYGNQTCNVLDCPCTAFVPA